MFPCASRASRASLDTYKRLCFATVAIRAGGDCPEHDLSQAVSSAKVTYARFETKYGQQRRADPLVAAGFGYFRVTERNAELCISRLSLLTLLSCLDDRKGGRR
jgi:hypothetical protein